MQASSHAANMRSIDSTNTSLSITLVLFSEEPISATLESALVGGENKLSTTVFGANFWRCKIVDVLPLNRWSCSAAKMVELTWVSSKWRAWALMLRKLASRCCCKARADRWWPLWPQLLWLLPPPVASMRIFWTAVWADLLILLLFSSCAPAVAGGVDRVELTMGRIWPSTLADSLTIISLLSKFSLSYVSWLDCRCSHFVTLPLESPVKIRMGTLDV